MPNIVVTTKYQIGDNVKAGITKGKISSIVVELDKNSTLVSYRITYDTDSGYAVTMPILESRVERV
jgi:hypothetical protein